MRISEQTIRQIQQTADIVEVVEDFVSLKKKGQNWWACCPFHHEKSPSFSVAPAKGIYKCFGCGKAGDSVKFIMDIEGIGYVEALKYLAQKYNIAIEEEQSSPQQVEIKQQKESIYIALNFAKKHYQNILTQTDEGKSLGISYFKERGFTDKTIEAFELGFSRDNWHDLEQNAVKAGYDIGILEQAGLLVTKDDKRYDRFRNRVMFPIHNLSGRVVGFGARTLKKGEQPKYLNSPETEVYHKSDILYGIFFAKNAIRQADNCYLVEGYTDVISLHQAGIENVVASSGTSLTENQIKLIKRFTPNVTVLYDGDAAGIKASLRGIDLLLEQGLNVKVALVPDGEDPDSYVKKIGGTAFKDFLQKEAKDFILFKTKLFLDETQNDPLKKAHAIRDIVESIAKIPDAIQRSVFYKECSRLLGVDEEVLVSEGNKQLVQVRKKQRDTKQVQPTPHELAQILPEGVSLAQELEPDALLEFPELQPAVETASPIFHQEREILRILVAYGTEETEDDKRLFHYIFDEIGNVPFQHSEHIELLQFYQNSLAAGILPDERYLINNAPQALKELIINLITDNHLELSNNWEGRFKIFAPEKDALLHSVVYTAILRMKFRHNKKLYNELLRRLQHAEAIEEMTEIQKLMLTLKKEQNDLAKILGIVVSW